MAAGARQQVFGILLLGGGIYLIYILLTGNNPFAPSTASSTSTPAPATPTTTATPTNADPITPPVQQQNLVNALNLSAAPLPNVAQTQLAQDLTLGSAFTYSPPSTSSSMTNMASAPYSNSVQLPAMTPSPSITAISGSVPQLVASPTTSSTTSSTTSNPGLSALAPLISLFGAPPTATPGTDANLNSIPTSALATIFGAGG